MKVCIIGAGGIGSFFSQFLSHGIKTDIKGLEDTQITLIDKDLVEEKNLLYANYDVFDVAKEKTDVLADRYGFKKDTNLIQRKDQLLQYDLIVLCVDNNAVRQLAYDTRKPLLDMRAKGKGVFVQLLDRQNREEETEWLKTLENNDNKEGCQREQDISEKTIQAGNIISASIGYQLLLNYLRGETAHKVIAYY